MLKYTLLLLTVSAGLARADSLTLNISYAEIDYVLGTADGLNFRIDDTSWATYLSSNPQAPGVVEIGSRTLVHTGPLVASTGTSWTFAGGSFLHDATGLGYALTDVPEGYSTCEAAGLIFRPNFLGDCQFSPSLVGTFTGDVTLSLGDIIWACPDF